MAPQDLCEAATCVKEKRSGSTKYCPKHQSRFDRFGDPFGTAKTHERVDISGPCSIGACDKPKFGTSSTYCPAHASRKKKGLANWDEAPLRRSGNQTAKTCSQNGCSNKVDSKGMCANHYRQDRKRKGLTGKCKFCEEPAWAKGMCHKHLSAVNRNGRHDPPSEWPLELYISERFMGKRTKYGCIPWTGQITSSGHGRFCSTRDTFGETSAHRILYAIHNGPIPDGYVVGHICHKPSECDGGTSCRHRRCVNPEHLKLVTRAENSSVNRRNKNSGKMKHAGLASHGLASLDSEGLTAWAVRFPDAWASLVDLGREFRGH